MERPLKQETPVVEIVGKILEENNALIMKFYISQEEENRDTMPV